MTKSRLYNKKNIFLFLGIFLVVDIILFTFINFLKASSGVELGFSAELTDYYNYQKVPFSYDVTNKSSAANAVVLKLAECGIRGEMCRDIWQKNLSLKGKEIQSAKADFMDKTTNDFGSKTLILSALAKDGTILVQKSVDVNLKNFIDELYLSLETDRDLVADGDYVRLNYIFINKSGVKLDKKDFALTINYAGPTEIAQNSGRLVEDISQDIVPGQTVNGKAVWVTNDYNNRQGGVFNVSLLLSHREQDSTLSPLANIVKQVHWP